MTVFLLIVTLLLAWTTINLYLWSVALLRQSNRPDYQAHPYFLSTIVALTALYHFFRGPRGPVKE